MFVSINMRVPVFMVIRMLERRVDSSDVPSFDSYEDMTVLMCQCCQ